MHRVTPELRAEMGRAFGLVEQKKFGSARDLLRSVVERWPDSPDAHSELALCYRHLGELDDSVHHLKIATTLAPHEPKFWNNLGFSWFLEGAGGAPTESAKRLLEAEAAVVQALEVDPMYPQARKALRLVHRVMAARKVESARRIPPEPGLEHLLDNRPFGLHCMSRAKRALSEQDPVRGARWMTRAAIASPGSADFRLALARLLSGLPKEAHPLQVQAEAVTEEWARKKRTSALVVWACGGLLLLGLPHLERIEPAAPPPPEWALLVGWCFVFGMFRWGASDVGLPDETRVITVLAAVSLAARYLLPVLGG